EEKADSIRYGALYSLSSIGPDAAEAIPALVKMLADKKNNNGIRTTAADVLAAFGPKAEPAIPALVAVITDPERGCGGPRSAANAFVAVAPKASRGIREQVLPAIKKAMGEAGPDGTRFEQDNPPVWTVFGETAAPLIPALIDYVHRQEGRWPSVD